MPRKPIDFDAVRKIALAMPEVEDGTAYGAPCLKLRGKMFAGLAVNASAEPGTLGLRVSFEERDRLLRERPEVYYITAHYANYPGVLIRMTRISRAELKRILDVSWQFAMERAAKPKARGRARARGSEP